MKWPHLVLAFVAFALAVFFFRFEFLVIRVSETKEIVQRCNHITGKCEAATPLTKDGVIDMYGLKKVTQ